MDAATHAERRTGAGGSMVAGMLDLPGSFQRPRDVYEYIVNGTTQDETEAMRMGNVMEPVICDLYLGAHESEALNLREVKKPSVSKDLPEWVRGLPDRKVFSGPKFLRLLECKNVGPGMAAKFDEAHNEVPLAYYVQCLWYLLAHPQADRLDLAALMRGNHYVEFQIEHDERAEQTLLNKVGEWWEKHIVLKVPPPISQSVDADKLRRELYPKSTAVIRQASPEVVDWAFQVKNLEEKIKRDQKNVTDLTGSIKDFIAGDGGVEGAFGRLLYRYDSKGRASWKGVAAAFRGVAHEALQHELVLASSEGLVHEGDAEKAHGALDARLDALVNDNMTAPSRKFIKQWAEER